MMLLAEGDCGWCREERRWLPTESKTCSFVSPSTVHAAAHYSITKHVCAVEQPKVQCGCTVQTPKYSLKPLLSVFSNWWDTLLTGLAGGTRDAGWTKSNRALIKRQIQRKLQKQIHNILVRERRRRYRSATSEEGGIFPLKRRYGTVWWAVLIWQQKINVFEDENRFSCMIVFND